VEEEDAMCASVCVEGHDGAMSLFVLALGFGEYLVLAASYLALAASYLRLPLLCRVFFSWGVSLVRLSSRFISSMMLVSERWCVASSAASSVVVSVVLGGLWACE
jgi:hypothetical protein